MANYICKCCDHEESTSGISIRVIDGAVRYDIKCPCGEYMDLKDPKSGAPSFRSNRYGQVM